MGRKKGYMLNYQAYHDNPMDYKTESPKVKPRKQHKPSYTDGLTFDFDIVNPRKKVAKSQIKALEQEFENQRILKIKQQQLELQKPGFIFDK